MTCSAVPQPNAGPRRFPAAGIGPHPSSPSHARDRDLTHAALAAVCEHQQLSIARDHLHVGLLMLYLLTRRRTELARRRMNRGAASMMPGAWLGPRRRRRAALWTANRDLAEFSVTVIALAVASVLASFVMHAIHPDMIDICTHGVFRFSWSWGYASPDVVPPAVSDRNPAAKSLNPDNSVGTHTTCFKPDDTISRGAAFRGAGLER
jgi:hypothetical protein